MNNLNPIFQAIAKFNKTGFVLSHESTVNEHNTFSLKLLIMRSKAEANSPVAEVVFYHNPSTNSETRFSANVAKLFVTELTIEESIKQHLEVLDFIKDVTSESMIQLVKVAASNATKETGKKFKESELRLSKENVKVKSTTSMAEINYMLERIEVLRGNKEIPVKEQEAQISLVAHELLKTGEIISHTFSVSMDKRTVFKVGDEAASKAATQRAMVGMWITKSDKNKYTEIIAK